MTIQMNLRLDILPAPQRRVWTELSDVPETFVLYGGTALALQLGHRQSEDFDFFANHLIDTGEMIKSIPFLTNARITQREPNTLTCLVERGGPVKVSFFGLPDLAPRWPILRAAENNLKLANLLDLAATKVAVVQQRAQRKDYLDIDALITVAGIELAAQLAAAQLVYGSAFSAMPTLKALCYYGDGDLTTLPIDVQLRLTQAAARVDPLNLPTLSSLSNTEDP
jgi:Nucleotidyl transferase AbiEii toxin, Type IV TA system